MAQFQQPVLVKEQPKVPTQAILRFLREVKLPLFFLFYRCLSGRSGTGIRKILYVYCSLADWLIWTALSRLKTNC